MADLLSGEGVRGLPGVDIDAGQGVEGTGKRRADQRAVDERFVSIRRRRI
jgi:hypothetical protein